MGQSQPDEFDFDSMMKKEMAVTAELRSRLSGL